MIWIRSEWRPFWSTSKLQVCSVSSFKILKLVGPNAYVIDLPSHFGCYSTFNVEDLVAYKDHINPSDNPFLPLFVDPQPESVANLTSTPPITIRKDKINVILYELIMLTNYGEIQHFFVRRVGQLNSTDPDLLELCRSRQDLPLPDHHSRLYGHLMKFVQSLSLWLGDWL